ncbi:uncharacterized protein LOC132304569 [Cornus florida]|uniref:uncharacterized protein LOC132304569 n=1 Tax=Cornus florida TaxID=4283 RepID=UPI00289751D7|nr:uncharacterized protein LOC132304569 [Cornus florida]
MRTSGDPSSHAISDSCQEMKPSLVVLTDDLASSSLLSFGCRCGNSDSIAKDISPQSRESSSGGEKVKETSDFSKPGQHVSAGSGSVCCHKCKNMGHAAESCPMISTRAPILDVGTSKEVDRSSRTDLRPMFCNQPDEFRIFSVPKLDYIWKGVFEIQSSGRLPSFCYGIQAHLSTCSSPKVPEEVKKFPHKILLEEVPRLSTWPNQFLGNHPEEDLESYGRNYKSMLECMINYDLALIGKFDGIELLIFSSNKEHEVTERKQGVSASQGPVGGMSEVMSSKSQVMASDYKDQLGFEFLDLQLSLGAGKNLTTQRLRPSFLGIVEEKHNQDKVPSCAASKKNNDGGEFPVSLDLSLTLPSHDKRTSSEASFKQEEEKSSFCLRV